MNRNNLEDTIETARRIFDIIGRTAVYALGTLFALGLIYLIGALVVAAFVYNILMGIFILIVIIAITYLIFN